VMPSLRPRYMAVVEERLYLEHPLDSDRRSLRPDIVVTGNPPVAGGAAVLAPAAARGMVTVTLPMLEEEREPYIEIRLRDGGEVVAVIELLSPANKRAGSNGHREYLEKRELVLQSSAHLVELDFLRGDARLPMRGELPPADGYALVSRAGRRPLAQVWPWTLRQPLPVIPIPLAGDDPDVLLDLQAVFTTVYDRAGYDYSLDYRRAPDPALSDADASWGQGLLSALAASG